MTLLLFRRGPLDGLVYYQFLYVLLLSGHVLNNICVFLCLLVGSLLLGICVSFAEWAAYFLYKKLFVFIIYVCCVSCVTSEVAILFQQHLNFNTYFLHQFPFRTYFLYFTVPAKNLIDTFSTHFRSFSQIHLQFTHLRLKPPQPVHWILSITNLNSLMNIFRRTLGAAIIVKFSADCSSGVIEWLESVGVAFGCQESKSFLGFQHKTNNSVENDDKSYCPYITWFIISNRTVYLSQLGLFLLREHRLGRGSRSLLGNQSFYFRQDCCLPLVEGNYLVKFITLLGKGYHSLEKRGRSCSFTDVMMACANFCCLVWRKVGS